MLRQPLVMPLVPGFAIVAPVLGAETEEQSLGPMGGG